MKRPGPQVAHLKYQPTGGTDAICYEDEDCWHQDWVVAGTGWYVLRKLGFVPLPGSRNMWTRLPARERRLNSDP